MLFHTGTFFVFFALVYAAYIFLNHRRQNQLLLAASFIFYGWWDWRFLGLLMISIAVDYTFARKIEISEDGPSRKMYLVFSLVINLGILGVFKYLNFFLDSFTHLAASFGFTASVPVLNILLPVGISFYTFQSLSYVVDVYRRQMPACRNLRDYALFVSFFPQLVAGPIERARHLLGQIQQPRDLSVEAFKSGCFLFFWGVFQKIYVGDGLSRQAGWAFEHSGTYTAAQVVIGTLAFTWQIYGDFAGYSNMARGLARMLGFELMVNFDHPYFSASMREFWRRWHISLSLWIRDYLYVPLGGRSGGLLRQCLVLIATMAIAGLWHGAAWTFVAWGTYHGILLAGERLCAQSGKPRSGAFTGVKTFLVFILVAYGLLIFRAHSLAQAGEMTRSLVLDPFSGWMESQAHLRAVLCLILPLWFVEFFEIQTGKQDLISRCSPVIRWLLYLCFFHMIIYSGVPSAQQFIYFQF